MQKKASYAEANARWTRPCRAVLAVSIGPEGPADIIALGWKMHTSIRPPMVAISVGLTRHSHKLIEETGEFVLSVPGEDMAAAVLFCGTHSGRDTDKFKEAGLTPMPAKVVKPPLIGEALVNLECVVRGKLLTGDHTIFAGEVVACHVSEKEGPVLVLHAGESGIRSVLDGKGYRFGVVRDK
jgi:flavin reductase (DIM6/NTAB) family NADH-FMN oxidoreductase RutF